MPVDPQVSLVVCGYNAAAHLPALLESVGRQSTERAAFEVVYVDDGSTDGSADLAERSGAVDVVLRCPARRGAASARNRGLAQARAATVAFVDADTVLDADFVERGIERTAGAEDVLLAGGIRVPVGPRPTVAAMVDATSYLDQERAVRHGYGASANLWLARDAALALGGFDERIPAVYGEDEEFCRRATRAGLALTYAPEVCLSHPPRSRMRDVWAKSYRIGRARAVIRRLPPPASTAIPRDFRSPHAYRPPGRLREAERLARLEHDPTGPELLALYVARYLLVQVAILAGDMAGELRARRGPARVA